MCFIIKKSIKYIFIININKTMPYILIFKIIYTYTLIILIALYNIKNKVYLTKSINISII